MYTEGAKPRRAAAAAADNHAEAVRASRRALKTQDFKSEFSRRCEHFFVLMTSENIIV